MIGAEKVLSILIAILVIICIVLSVQVSNNDIDIGAKEAHINAIHKESIKVIDNQIYGLREIIVTLQTENDSLRNEKAKIRTVIIHEIDSVRALPFVGKRVFFTREAARIDSISKRYVSRD